jgi:hypothetical protein
MQPVFYVLAIMGCGDGSQACQAAVRVEPAHYATVAQCRAELPTALARNTDIDFPVVAAECRRNGPTALAVRGKGVAKG